MTPIGFSKFASSLTSETAFDVLAVAKRLKSSGKDVIELQIGDSPFPSTKRCAGSRHQGYHRRTHALLRFDGSAAVPRSDCSDREERIQHSRNSGERGGGSRAKVFETYFCELFVEPGDSVLLFSPQFPTFEPNIFAPGRRSRLFSLKQQNSFRPDVNDVERFLKTANRPRAIFLNSPHNPTGGVATAEDLKAIADLIRGRDIALLSDEPYCHMVWEGKHRSILAEPGMLEQCVGAYTFSKSYSMSGWRVGYAISSPHIAEMIGKMINTSLSCVPPITQLAAMAALQYDAIERDETMAKFHRKVELLVNELRKVDGVKVLMPVGTFYVFPDVSSICQHLRIRSHGLAMYLLEGADDKKGVACLGGECFGAAGQGFLLQLRGAGRPID